MFRLGVHYQGGDEVQILTEFECRGDLSRVMPVMYSAASQMSQPILISACSAISREQYPGAAMLKPWAAWAVSRSA